MTDTKTIKDAQDSSKYSASDANKNNQKENAHPPGKKAREGKDPMEGDEKGDSDTGV